MNLDRMRQNDPLEARNKTMIETALEYRQKAKGIFSPAKPTKLEDLDIPQSLVEDLVLRYLLTKASSSISELSNALKLSFSLLHELFQLLRQRQFFEITEMRGRDYYFTLSGIGRRIAEKRFSISHYIGPAPVSIKSYHEAVRSQVVDLDINRELLKNTLSDLVVTDKFLDQLGPALISQKPIFIYGPTGNGKTSVVSRLIRIYQDPVLMPYAVEIDSQIIVLYDPSVHEKIDTDTPDLDQRWVACRRPCIIAGGELAPNMLELQLEENSKVYAAPLQMKANNGMFVIDDFGRQVLSPRYLLNRWIIPLDKRVDFLSLNYGLNFKIPFEQIVIFSTNLDPNDLADEAFLRRLQNKIYLDAVDATVFDEIFHRLVSERNLPCEPGSEELLRKLCLDLGAKDLRACYPLDIIDIIMSIGTYEKELIYINKENLERAVSLYFTKPKTPLQGNSLTEF